MIASALPLDERTIVRDMNEADIEAVSALTARVFATPAVEATAIRLASAYRACPFLRVDHAIVAEREGRIVAKWQALDLQLRVGSMPVRVAGLHTVVVEPQVDGEGLAWKMVPRGLERLRALGHDLAVGLAQKGVVYSALGAKPIGADYAWSVDAWRMPKKEDPSMRLATEADVARIVELSAAAQSQRSASLVRTTEMWPWIERRPAVIWIAPEGYVGIRDADDAVEVREIAGSIDFHGRALAALGAYAERRGVRRIRGHLPPDHALVQASIDLGARVVADYPRRSGVMAAVLDASTLLPKVKDALFANLARSPFAGRALDLTLACSLGGDAPPTVGHLRWGGAGEGEPSSRIRIAISGGGLAQALFGYRAFAAVEGAVVDGHPELASALFPVGVPFLQHTDRW